MIAGLMRDNQDKRPEDDNVALPLTHRELLVVMQCLVIACESERIDATDKRIAGVIRARIARFAERQGAWWDMKYIPSQSDALASDFPEHIVTLPHDTLGPLHSEGARDSITSLQDSAHDYRCSQIAGYSLIFPWQQSGLCRRAVHEG
jgi:hypothetical protein